jgi:O-antigen/teichoic acid export membrane protein
VSERSRHGLGTRTVRGMFWSYGSYVGTRGASLLATAILTRIISPKDFGLVALAGTFMTFLDMLQGLGVGNALVITNDDEVHAHAETAFAVCTGVGVFLALITAGLGPPAAALFHQPRLIELMPVLGLTFFLYGLGSTHYSLAMKSMDFRSRTSAEMADALARGIVGVTLALAGAGVWSLVAGYIAGTIAMDVVLWTLVRWRPRLRPQRRHLRALLSFGGASTAVGIMAACLGEFDNAVVGKVLGVTQLGYYSIATKLPYLFIISLAVVAGDVLFPAFATLERKDMGRAFLTGLEYTAMIALPLTATLVVLAEPITLGVFGRHWRPAIPAMQVLCVWAVVSPISMVCGNAFKSRGRANIVLLIAIPQAIAIIVGSLLIARQGIVAMSWLQAGIAIAAQIITIAVAQRMFELRVRSVLAAVRAPALASAALAAALIGMHQEISSPWPAIGIGGAVGLVVYAAVLHLLAPDLLRRLRSWAFPSTPPRGRAGGRVESAIATGDPDSMIRPPTIAPRESTGPA